ncbi:hypothetical protein LTR93_011611 [Exophiala xenobiotica]|nr:hypothetical protein LTR93_011611 [Exophiala xenobiotica]
MDGRAVRPEDSTVVVSVTKRSQRNLTKHYPGINIDWTVVQMQLYSWSQYFHQGKKLRVNLSFNCVQVSALSNGNPGRRGDKRGATSATQRMLAERESSLEAEQATLGRPSIWQQVYVEQVHQFQSQDDVPLALRQQLYAEEQQRRKRKSSRPMESQAGSSPVTINILPNHSQLPLVPDAQARSVASVEVWDSTPAADLEIEGPRDVAVEEYAEWQQDQVRNALLKQGVQKARNAMLEEGFDLEQVYEERNSKFLVDRGVKPGIAKRFADDIGVWSKRRKADHRAEMDG